MLTEVQRDYIAQAVRTMQIIVSALAAGVLMFLVMTLIIPAKDAPAEPFLAYMAVGFAVMAFAGWLIVPGIIANQARRSLAEGRVPQPTAQSEIPPEVGVVGHLVSVFQTRLIVGSALLEGAAFFGLIAFMIERQFLALSIAASLLLIIVSQIPTRNRVENWVTREIENIEQMRPQ